MMGQRATTKLILLLPFALALFAGCGKKGQLIPPEALVPAAVQNLQVQQKGEDFRITWQAPAKEQGGRPLRDLAEFSLLRRDVAKDGSDCASCPEAWKLLTAIDLDLPGKAKQGSSGFIYFDRGLPSGSVSQYRLLALSKSGGRSSPATSPLRKMLPAIAAPAIKAVVLPAAIRISFSFTVPTAAKLLGFNIYRRLKGAEPSLQPLNIAPVPQGGWEDQQLQFGQTYSYSATALVETGGETAESLPSEESELLFSLQELR